MDEWFAKSTYAHKFVEEETSAKEKPVIHYIEILWFHAQSPLSCSVEVVPFDKLWPLICTSGRQSSWRPERL